MKKIFLLLLVYFLSATSIFSQCEINNYIQENYELDAIFLALRDILNDPSDPDYDNPFLPIERTIPYLEKLSAIYENPNNNVTLDSLFNDFNIHVNQEYNYPLELRKITFSVETAIPWVEDFKNTGVSGVPALDDLMSDYLFSIESYQDYSSCSCTYFRLVSAHDLLNGYALIDDFEVINDIDYAGVYGPSIELRFNYTGISYNLNGSPVAVCDIIISDGLYNFYIYSGDCMSGCLYRKYWTVQVTEDCEVTLDTTINYSLSNFSIYPNPTSDIISLTGVPSNIASVTIYNIQGQIVKAEGLENKTINVSTLISGMYFLKIQTNDGRNSTQKFIKN